MSRGLGERESPRQQARRNSSKRASSRSGSGSSVDRCGSPPNELPELGRDGVGGSPARDGCDRHYAPPSGSLHRFELPGEDKLISLFGAHAESPCGLGDTHRVLHVIHRIHLLCRVLQVAARSTESSDRSHDRAAGLGPVQGSLPRQVSPVSLRGLRWPDAAQSSRPLRGQAGDGADRSRFERTVLLRHPDGFDALSRNQDSWSSGSATRGFVHRESAHTYRWINSDAGSSKQQIEELAGWARLV